MKTLSKSKGVNKKFKGGGYFKSEEVMPGVTVMEMDGKGFVKEFVNEIPETILDDDIADWEHDNLESK